MTAAFPHFYPLIFVSTQDPPEKPKYAPMITEDSSPPVPPRQNPPEYKKCVFIFSCLFCVYVYVSLIISFPTPLPAFDSLPNTRSGDGWFPCHHTLWINSLCNSSFRWSLRLFSKDDRKPQVSLCIPFSFMYLKEQVGTDTSVMLIENRERKMEEEF